MTHDRKTIGYYDVERSEDTSAPEEGIPSWDVNVPQGFDTASHPLTMTVLTELARDAGMRVLHLVTWAGEE